TCHRQWLCAQRRPARWPASPGTRLRAASWLRERRTRPGRLLAQVSAPGRRTSCPPGHGAGVLLIFMLWGTFAGPGVSSGATYALRLCTRSVLSSVSLRHLEKEPGATLRLVNERLQNTRRGDVAALLADRVRGPLSLDQVSVVVQ